MHIIALRGFYGSAGGQSVSTARHNYREKALDCLMAAERVHDPAEKMKLLEIAQQWMALAEHIAHRLEQGTAHRDPEAPTSDS